MRQVVLYYREVLAGWFLNVAMFIAPRKMSLHIARGLYHEFKIFAQDLKDDEEKT